MAKETFERKKPHVNVGTIGHIDHGKTTLTSAILAVQAAKGLAQKKSYADIAKGGTVRDETKTVTIAVAHVEYETQKRHYAHIDCPGHADFIKNMISGASNLQCALLVVSACDGPQTQTKEHIKIALATKIPNIVVVLNKMDILVANGEEELVDFTKDEILGLLKANGYNKDVTFIPVSAITALKEATEKSAATEYGVNALKKIGETIDAVDLNDNSEKNTLPFCLTIEDTYSISGRGTVVAGKVEAGMIKREKDLKLDIITVQNKRITVDITDMQIFKQSVDSLSTGDNAALLVKGIERDSISRGDIIGAQGAYQPFYFAKVELFMFPHSEGGRKSPVGLKYTPHVFIGARSTPAEIIKIEGETSIEPGKMTICWMAFKASMIKTPDNKSLIVRESSSTIGVGVIVETANTSPVSITTGMVKNSEILKNITQTLKIKVTDAAAA